MQQFNNNQYFQEVRALALVVAEQKLSVRQNILELILANKENPKLICIKHFPQFEWNSLISQKLNLYRHELDSAVSIFEEAYPKSLRQIEDPAWILFFKGSKVQQIDNKKSVAIVGSRRADYAGLELAELFAFELAKLGITIISGLALGIDSAAHAGALKTNLPLSTIAVLGSGINLIYPATNQQLYDQIIKNKGIVLSQFEPDYPPYPSNFLNRNRIVSGLSSATVVIQASLRSGSLVTARHSIEQGRDVYVVPGDIDNLRYQGSNKLIQQGAQLITGIENLIEHLGLHVKNTVVSKNENIAIQASPLKNQILKILEDQGEIKVDQLLRLLGAVSFEKDLLELEISAAIERLPGNILKIKN